MYLKKGLGLFNKSAEVFINSGTLPYQEQSLEKVQYLDWHFTPLFDEDAYLPKRDWREMSKEEKRVLAAGRDRRDYNTIYVGDVPPGLKERLQALSLTDALSREEVMQRFKASEKAVQEVNKEMQQFLAGISGGKGFHFHCIAANLPNLEMTACDISRLPAGFTVPERKYIGLHNDGTQFMTLHTTHRFGNRITINLGAQSRIFYFVNLSMIQVVNMLRQKIDLKAQGVTIYNVAAFFFRYFPDYPVIKVLQKPYQYYIAPTDNCFHDGSTLGNTALDINMVYFGAFRC